MKLGGPHLAGPQRLIEAVVYVRRQVSSVDVDVDVDVECDHREAGVAHDAKLGAVSPTTS